MPAIPQHYSSDFISLIEAMLNADPRKRPTAARILRDQFIKKNILLFLERTKLKQLQAQQMEQENRLKYEQAKPTPPVVEKSSQSTPRSNNYQNVRPKSANDMSDKNNNLRDRNSSPQRSVSSQNKKLHEASEVRKSNGSKPRVRISSVVENIETREFFKLQSIEPSLDEFNDSSEEEETAGGAYELTKPMQKQAGGVTPIGWKNVSPGEDPIGWKFNPKNASPSEERPQPHRPKVK
jgi:serine/threonine protein kinase